MSLLERYQKSLNSASSNDQPEAVEQMATLLKGNWEKAHDRAETVRYLIKDHEERLEQATLDVQGAIDEKKAKEKLKKANEFLANAMDAVLGV